MYPCFEAYIAKGSLEASFSCFGNRFWNKKKGYQKAIASSGLLFVGSDRPSWQKTKRNRSLREPQAQATNACLETAAKTSERTLLCWRIAFSESEKTLCCLHFRKSKLCYVGGALLHRGSILLMLAALSTTEAPTSRSWRRRPFGIQDKEADTQV